MKKGMDTSDYILAVKVKKKELDVTLHPSNS